MVMVPDSPSPTVGRGTSAGKARVKKRQVCGNEVEC